MSNSSWWLLEVQTSDPDEVGAQLLERGSAGVEIPAPGLLRSFWNLRDDEVHTRKAELTAAGLSITSCSLVPERNWVQEAGTSWPVLTPGALTILPVVSTAAAPPPAPGTIQIVPGCGFGTGHHATTFMILELLQHPAVTATRPHRSLDLGTGSGVLALATAHLYGCPVDAIDTDATALENAAENTVLNQQLGLVNLIHGDVAAARGVYNLITANIYAEVLCDLEPRFQEHLAVDGSLILSGIMTSLTAQVEHAYHGWRLIESRQKDGWCALLYTR